MAYGVELSESADRELRKLDRESRRRILKFLYGRLAKLDDFCSIGQVPHGYRLGEFCKEIYR